VAANEVKLTVRIAEDGNLDIVAKKSKKAAKEIEAVAASTDKVNKSRNKFSKQEKGVAGLTSNSTKGFAKQAQTVGGTLVPAYATLAANIFAVTAAFGALQRAAQVEQLTQGLVALGTVSGIAMGTLSKELRTATGNALSLEEAMRSTSIVISAGFDSSTLAELGEVARNASIALGRDTADSLSRLTRGATKLEPELLDELGIMVRLDEATSNYALQLGKSVNEMTLFEKRQAFMNAVLEEGQRKFSAIGESVETNPYDQLAASFNDLAKSSLNLLNTVLGPLVSVLASSTAALIGVLTIFGSTVSKQMLPVLGQFAEKAKNAATRQAEFATSQLASLKSLEGASKAVKTLGEAAERGEVGQKKLAAALKGAGLSVKRNTNDLQRLIAAENQDFDAITRKKKMVEESIRAQNQLSKAIFANTVANIQNAEATSIAAFEQGNLKEGLKLARAELSATAKATKTYIQSSAGGAKVLGALRGGFVLGAQGARIFGAALINMIPVIGQIIFVLGLLGEGVSFIYNKFFKTEAQKQFEAASESLRSVLEETKNTLVEVDLALEGNSRKITTVSGRYEALGNSLGTLFSKFQEVNRLAADGSTILNNFGKDIRVEVLEDALNSSVFLQRAFEEIYGPGQRLENVLSNVADKGAFAGQVMKALEERIMGNVTAFRAFASSIEAANRPIDEFFEQFRVKTPLDQIAASFKDLDLSIKNLGATANSQDVAEVIGEKAGANLLKLLGLQTQLNDALEIYKATRAAPMSATREFGEETLENVVSLARERIQLFAEEFAEGRKVLAVNAERQKVVQAELKTLQQIKGGREIAAKVLEKENELIDLKITALDTTLNIARRVSQLNTQDKEAAELVIAYEEQRKELVKDKIDLAEGAVRLAESELNFTKAQIALNKTNLDLQNRALQTRRSALEVQEATARFQREQENRQNALISDRTGALTVSDEYDIQRRFLADKIKIESDAYELRNQGIENEFKLLSAQYAFLRAQATLVNTQLEAYGIQGAGFDLTMIDSAIANLASAEKDALQDSANQYAQTIIKLIRQLEQTKADALNASVNAEGSILEKLRVMTGAGGVFASGTDANLRDKIAATQNLLQPQIEALKSLGPEGELVSALVTSAFTVSDAWVQAFEIIGNAESSTSEKIAAGLGAVSTTLSAVQQTFTAASQMRIKGIESEIEAEKKRDGKSAESLAKIQQLERKKETLKKKEFETNKKLMLANAVISTAAGVAAALSAGPIGLVIAPLIAALGAAQIAIIAGMSYQGGATAGDVATPTSVTAGQRRTTTDLARSQSGAGELAYFRGAMGTGGPENFQPSNAFAGMKYRANGGNTGVMVGEQGPELFVPDRPGRIVPSDEVQQSSVSNINFSINAVDAAGVEEVLINQRGNIIGMLREAANAHGQEFLEAVDVSVYAAPDRRTV
jgi:hypothetical protein